mgnify:FL=1
MADKKMKDELAAAGVVLEDAPPKRVQEPAPKAGAAQLVASLQEYVRSGFGVTDEQLQEIADAL